MDGPFILNTYLVLKKFIAFMQKVTKWEARFRIALLMCKNNEC